MSRMRPTRWRNRSANCIYLISWVLVQSTMFLRRFTVAFCLILATRAEEPTGCTRDGKTFKVDDQFELVGQCKVDVCNSNNKWTTEACYVDESSNWTLVTEDFSKPFPYCCTRTFPTHDIVPDILDTLPTSAQLLDVVFTTNIVAVMGNVLAPAQVKSEPSVNYSLADSNSWYLLCMTNPDAPSRQEPQFREFLHWLVGNIPGNNVTDGDVLDEYVGYTPLEESGFHRYFLLLYKQPEKLVFEEPRVTKTCNTNRTSFSIRKFAEKYKLGEPVAINMFLTH